MNATWQVKALQAADEMERQAQVLREAVRIMDGRATAKAKQAFGGKIQQAMKLTKQQPSYGGLLDTVKALLASGPKTIQEMKAGLDGITPAADVGRRLLDIKNRGHITISGKRGAKVYALASSKTRHISSNGTDPIYPVVLPKRMTFQQRKSVSSYAIWQIGQAANGQPISMKSILASLKKAQLKGSGHSIGAAVRYGIIAIAGGTKSNRLYTVTDKTAADFPQFTQEG